MRLNPCGPLTTSCALSGLNEQNAGCIGVASDEEIAQPEQMACLLRLRLMLHNVGECWNGVRVVALTIVRQADIEADADRLRL